MKKIDRNAKIAVIDELSDALLRRWDEAESLHDDALLKSAFDEMRLLSAKITEATRRDAVLSRLDDADAARDEKIRAVSDLLKGYSAISIPEMKAAAKSLKATFDKYGLKIAGENFAEESALLESLLGDFSTDEAKAAAKVLAGVSDAISALRKAQDEFAVAQDEFVAAKAGKGESATSLKKPLVACINGKVVDYLSAARKMNGAKYEAFAALVEAEIERATRD